MIGDGINDATALTGFVIMTLNNRFNIILSIDDAESSVGCAMGANGSAMTVDAADLVIMPDNLLRVPSSIKFCRFIQQIVIENCVFSIAVKIVAVILALIG